MIVDVLENASLYVGLSDRLMRGLRFLTETDVVSAALGRHEIDGDDVYAIVMDYETKDVGEGFWEAHRRYIDIQYVADGEERIGWSPIGDLRVTGEYDEEKEYVKLAGEGNMLIVRAGTFVVFHPHDAHMPGISLSKRQAVRKVVVKVRV